MSKHRIASYNILSSHLSPPEYFPKCDPQNLKPETRLKRILVKLEAQIKQQSIICLQEISTLWVGELHLFFLKHNYYLVTGLYGKAKNGYMGVGIAFPLSKYSVEELKVETIANSRDWPKISPLELFWRSCFKGIMKSLGKPYGHLENSLYYAKSRLNQLVFVRLQDLETKKKFGVGTYHMPCAYYAPQVMTIHSAMVIQRMQILAKGDPGVLAGDFNISPTEPQYQLITTGGMDKSNRAYPSQIKGDSWKVELEVSWQSAYQEALGQEPDFTNYAQVKDKSPFIKTLDYIWLSKQWQVISVLPLPHRHEVTGPFPNEEEPSDHILIAAELAL